MASLPDRRAVPGRGHANSGRWQDVRRRNQHRLTVQSSTTPQDSSTTSTPSTQRSTLKQLEEKLDKNRYSNAPWFDPSTKDSPSKDDTKPAAAPSPAAATPTKNTPVVVETVTEGQSPEQMIEVSGSESSIQRPNSTSGSQVGNGPPRMRSGSGDQSPISNQNLQDAM